MNRNDNSKYIIYIEPKREEKLKSPINDELTSLMEMAISKAKKGTSLYMESKDNGSFRENMSFKGVHRTSCGEISSSHDFLLENGMITNSLAPFYLRWYRYSIPENDMIKIKQLEKFYEVRF